jgi:alpha-beta hydrolase superfamily lysophospholipase
VKVAATFVPHIDLLSRSPETTSEELIVTVHGAGAALVTVLFLIACSGNGEEGAETGTATTAAGSAATQPPSLDDACGSTAGIDARPLWLTTDDDIRLYAVEAGSGPIGIALAHQAPGNLCGWLPTVQRLAEAGYRVLAFDFRSYGQSQSPPDRDVSLALGNDLAAAVAHLRAGGAQRTFLIGASLGGAALVQAGASLQVDGVVSLSGTRFFPGYGVNDPGAVRRLTAPFLFLGSQEDNDVPVDEATALVSEIGSSDKDAKFYPGSWHGWQLIQDAPYAAEARALVLDWLTDRS